MFLKLGGSAITDKTRPYAARVDVIRRIAKEIKEARKELGASGIGLVLGHGSGSFGHYAAKESGFGTSENWGAYAVTGAAAGRLNRIVTDLFIEEGVPVVSMQPSASAQCRQHELTDLALEPIRTVLLHGMVPLLFGDVGLDADLGMTIISTEMIFRFLAPVLKPKRILMAGIVDGVFTADPLKEPAAKLIAEITPETFPLMESQLRGSHGYDVTGGMLGKIRAMMAIVQQTPSTRISIFSAMQEGAIFRALTERDLPSSTLIHA